MTPASAVAAINGLRTAFEGELVTPDTLDYDEARALSVSPPPATDPGDLPPT
jgi:hypothetical protein